MASTPPSLVAFRVLSQNEQLELLVSEAELLAPPKSNRVSYYKLGDYHVRVTLSEVSMRVHEVVTFDGGPDHERMLADLQVQ